MSERLGALAQAHEILNATRWTSASLERVVASAVAPLRADRIAIAGPRVEIGPKRALAMALAVNELATNSIKYGALSADNGRVDIKWVRRIEDDAPSLLWTWKEVGGPPVTPPTRRGFGRMLIERMLAADFEGSARIEFKPEGVECVLTAPWPGNEGGR